MVVGLDTFADIGIQPPGLLLVGFFGGFGLVHDLRAFGTRHFEADRKY